MWPDRRLTDLLEIEHPLVLAPMAGFGTVELAAAVCAAGGLGSIGCGPVPPPSAAKTIAELRALTNKPINVNFFCHAPAKADAGRERSWLDRLSPYYRALGIEAEPPPSRLDLPPFGDDMCKVVEDARPDVVSFHFGLPAPALLARIKAAGCRVMSSATTVAEARWLEARGVDVIIAQGYEAGGHRGMFLASDLDAAIADGRGIAAAFALGACGTQIGTAYLLCPEAATPPLHRDALRQADADATVLTNVFTGRPARVLPNRLTRELGPMADAAPDFPLPLGATAPLRAKAEQQGDGEFTPLWSGQAAALAREMPAQALTLALAQEAVARFKQMAG
jgi:nitronate monooxygenase